MGMEIDANMVPPSRKVNLRKHVVPPGLALAWWLAKFQ